MGLDLDDPVCEMLTRIARGTATDEFYHLRIQAVRLNCTQRLNDETYSKLASRHNAATRSRRRDPTGTTTLRRKYQSAFLKRFRRLRGLIRETIVENNALRLEQHFNPERRSQRNALRRYVQRNATPPSEITVAKPPFDFPDAAHFPRFDFPKLEDKLDAFESWMEKAEEEGVIEVQRGPSRQITRRAQWQRKYLQAAYRKGLRDANANLTKAGVQIPDEDRENLERLFARPLHADTVATIYSRNFEALNTVIQEGNQQVAETIRQTLTRGLAEGVSPQVLARRMVGSANDRISHVMEHRAKMIARTEIVHAYNEASLNRFQEFGITQVAGMTEWLIAGDNRVCPICQGLKGTLHSIDEAHGLIPIHPMCRCTWLPVTDMSGVEPLSEAA